MIPEEGHPCQSRDRLLEKFQVPPDFLRFKTREPRQVSAGPLQTGHEPPGNGIDHHREDDRDGGRGILGGPGRHGTHRYDDIRTKPDQFGGKFREALQPPLSPSRFDDDVAALDIAEVAKPLPEGLEHGARPRRCGSTRGGRQISDPRDSGRLLGRGDGGPQDDSESRHYDTRDSYEIHEPIPSSIAQPSRLAAGRGRAGWCWSARW